MSSQEKSYPDGLSYSEISQIMGISRERVRQIEASAFRKLKKSRLKDGKKWQELKETSELIHANKSEFDTIGKIVASSDGEHRFNNAIKKINRRLSA